MAAAKMRQGSGVVMHSCSLVQRETATNCSLPQGSACQPASAPDLCHAFPCCTRAAARPPSPLPPSPAPPYPPVTPSPPSYTGPKAPSPPAVYGLPPSPPPYYGGYGPAPPGYGAAPEYRHPPQPYGLYGPRQVPAYQPNIPYGYYAPPTYAAPGYAPPGHVYPGYGSPPLADEDNGSPIDTTHRRQLA